METASRSSPLGVGGWIGTAGLGLVLGGSGLDRDSKARVGAGG